MYCDRKGDFKKWVFASAIMTISMFKCALTGEYHRGVVFVTCFDDFVIAYASAWLYDRFHSLVKRYIDSVAEGEERVGHH